MIFSPFSKLFEFRGRALSFSSAFTWDHASAWAWTPPARGNGCRGALSSDVPGRAEIRAGSAPMELPSAMWEAQKSDATSAWGP